MSGWIIQDGNYGEFEAGREYRFALEFGSLRLVVDTEPVSEPRLSLVGSAIYEARGVIVFRSDSAWAVEFGIPAYEEGKAPAWASVGDPIRGRVYLGVDPSSSTERRKDVTGMPELIRTWFVRRILLNTTPWTDATDAVGQTIRTRDVARESFVEVPATDAWNHERGNAEYLLECELRPDPAVHRGPPGRSPMP